MADIQQWRRMIQTSRARTPAVEYDDFDAIHSALVPRQGWKPKAAPHALPYTGWHGDVRAQVSPECLTDDVRVFGHDLPYWSERDSHPSPRAERLIDSLMCPLMAEPHRALEPRFNSMLLLVFEGFRSISDENAGLRMKLQQETEARDELAQRMHEAGKRSQQVIQGYKAEVKRLELLLAKDEWGLVEVAGARHDCKIGRENIQDPQVDDGLESILEALERSRCYDDRAFSSQRAMFRIQPKSPSAQMRRLSKSLASKQSARTDLLQPPAERTPPAPSSALAEASLLEQSNCPFGADGDSRPLNSVLEPREGFSDDTSSTFSRSGDLLPDEIASVDYQPYEVTGGSHLTNPVKHAAGGVNQQIERNADAELGDRPCVVAASFRAAAMNQARGHKSHCVEKAGMNPTAVPALKKQPSLMSKASGFFQKLRPQLNASHSRMNEHRFSFEAGDDESALRPPGLGNVLQDDSNARTLRKSNSLSSMLDVAQRAGTTAPSASPLLRSPTVSLPASEIRRPSRIPTPIRRSGTLAYPRREREDSWSSLVTTLRQSDNDSRSDFRDTSQHGLNASRRLAFTGQEGPTSNCRSSRSPCRHARLERTGAIQEVATKADSDVTYAKQHF